MSYVCIDCAGGELVMAPRVEATYMIQCYGGYGSGYYCKQHFEQRKDDFLSGRAEPIRFTRLDP